MNILAMVLTVLGLCLFEVINSIDNAIINAEVLNTMQARARRWFLFWGILFAVFVVRGVLPFLIVWATVPQFTAVQAFMSTLNSNPEVITAIEAAAPLLLIAGGTFLILLFFHWLFMEPKHFGLIGEKFFTKQGVWFYTVASVFLTILVWVAIKRDPFMAFAAVIGSTAFFITHGFKQNAEQQEKELMKPGLSDISKVLYLEIIDLTFSIDGVLGAFAFTLAVPLILLGNGIGAIVVRQLTISNIDKIKKYKYLKNGAMYSILFLGAIMVLDAFGKEVPSYVSPLVTFGVVGFFFWKSRKEIGKEEKPAEKKEDKETE